jgi:hypothetical protein
MLPDPAKFAVVCVAACLIAFGNQDERRQTVPNQKQLVIQTLDLINNRISSIGRDPQFQVEAFRNSISPMHDHIRWLTGAAKSWRPESAEEGQNLRASLQRIQAALASIDAVTPRTLNLIKAIEDDLEIKTSFCRVLGLSTNAVVIASTKQDGLKEVKGLEVWYIEKFLAADAEAAPHRFGSFSSPATEQVAPGRYVFWSKSPPARRTGEKVEQCLCLPRVAAPSPPAPTFKIDLLAP